MRNRMGSSLNLDTTVVGLQGLPISTTAPSAGQALVFDGTDWTPTTVQTGGAIVPVNNVLPANPAVGELYWDLTTAKLFLWDGTQWVATINTPEGAAAGGPSGVQSVAAGAGLTGGTITDTGTIALSTPVSIANGGTAGTTAFQARQNLFANVMYFTLTFPGGWPTANATRTFAIPEAFQTNILFGFWWSCSAPTKQAGVRNYSVGKLTQAGVFTPYTTSGFTSTTLWTGVNGGSSSPVTFAQGDAVFASLSGDPTSDGFPSDVTFTIQLFRTT